MVETWDIIIVGAGPGGLTAGLYAARMGLKTIILEAGICGGRMLNAWQIENYPGFQTISGSELTAKMKAQTKQAGAEIRELTSVEEFRLDGPMKIAITADGEEFQAPAMILAMGATDVELGVPGETDYQGRGISYCATCDGPLFRQGTVAVIGGGNTAAMDVLFLANIAKKIYLVHRRDQLRADQCYEDRLKQIENVEILWDTIMTEIVGKDTVTSIKLENKKTGKKWVLEVEGVFIAVGCRSNSACVEPSGVTLDNKGNILVDKHQQTNIPGVYAVGDITGEPRQIVRASGDAVKAITHWLTERPKPS
jgi:thioredoxin reductase (NADPH)